MFKKKSDNATIVMLEGVICKTPVFGKLTSLSEFTINKGSKIPSHSHPHEQTGYLISGRLDFFIDGEKFVAEPGDSWSIPPEIDHSGEALEDTVVVEVFSPPREDLITGR